MPVLPLYMRHQQHRGNSRFDGDGADCVPALFSGLIHAVQANQAVLILKDQRSQFE